MLAGAVAVIVMKQVTPAAALLALLDSAVAVGCSGGALCIGTLSPRFAVRVLLAVAPSATLVVSHRADQRVFGEGLATLDPTPSCMPGSWSTDRWMPAVVVAGGRANRLAADDHRGEAGDRFGAVDHRAR